MAPNTDDRSEIDAGHDGHDEYHGSEQQQQQQQQQQQHESNVFGDQFELEDDDDFDVVADGYRPTNDGSADDGRQHRDHSIAFHHAPIHESSLSAFARLTPLSPPPPAPVPPLPSGSMRKSGRDHDENPFASPDDHYSEPSLGRNSAGLYAPGLLDSNPSGSSSSSVSSSSAAATTTDRAPLSRFGARPLSPLTGTAPKGDPSAFVSVTPNSPGRPSRPPPVPMSSGPQHPYTMYPQGVDDDLDDIGEDEELEPPQNPVPMGFLSSGPTYRRRLGPDGEEQDIIGDYGHVEQLPPYSRWPDGVPEKVPLLAEPAALHSRAPVMGSDPGMALMHTPLQPERSQSMSDRSALLSLAPPSSAPDALESASSTADSRAEHSLSEKSWRNKRWNEKRKTKFCGLPFWCYLLALGVMSLVSVILGGVIGGFQVGEQAGQNSNSAYYTTVTSLYDASLIAISATATTPPTGSYKLALGPPQATQSACISIPSQRSAWSCNLPGSNHLSFTVSASESNYSGGALQYSGGWPGSQLYYGAQASQMWTHFTQFIVVKDNSQPQDGPAYYFEQNYDKWVIVPKINFDPDNRTMKHEIIEDIGVVSPGDTPWFCYWNTTLLEVFVYIKMPAHEPTTATPSSPPPATTPAPDSLLSLTVTGPSTTMTYRGPSDGYSSWMSQKFSSTLTSSPLTTPTTIVTAATPTAASIYDPSTPSASAPNSVATPYTPLERRDHRKEFIIEDVIDPAGNSYYPFLVKIEERRLPDSPQPYCTQYQILDDGSWNYAPNPDGTSDPYTIALTENDPHFAVYQSAGIASDRRDRRGRRVPQDSVPGACHCQWLSGINQPQG